MAKAERQQEQKEEVKLKRYAKHKVRPELDSDGDVKRDAKGNATPKKLTDEPEQITKIEQWAVDNLNSQWENTGFYYFETK